MASDFNSLRKLYDEDKFADLLRDPDGVYWLKLRSVSRPKLLRQLCQKLSINYEGISSKNSQLLEYVFNSKPNSQELEDFIHEIYQLERKKRQENEDNLISQLYQMQIFNWGGLYQNQLEQTIINNYVKKIDSWDKLNRAIENEINASMRGYVQCSWYNHWTSIIIEDIFNDHPSVLPAVGKPKKVDFFIHNFPFDLKTTYFPDGYMKLLRDVEKLPSELASMKSFCKQENIKFEAKKPDSILFPELLTKISEHPSPAARDFIVEFRATRARLIQKAIDDPTDLKIWLYENQGVRRFDASNRFFLVLIDKRNLEDSWKLKRNKTLLVNEIHSHLDSLSSSNIENLQLEFSWQNSIYETYSDVLFVVFDPV
ncbi:MAG: hypothetical protein U7127_00740 [Phormidium sp.]